MTTYILHVCATNCDNTFPYIGFGISQGGSEWSLEEMCDCEDKSWLFLILNKLQRVFIMEVIKAGISTFKVMWPNYFKFRQSGSRDYVNSSTVGSICLEMGRIGFHNVYIMKIEKSRSARIINMDTFKKFEIKKPSHSYKCPVFSKFSTFYLRILWWRRALYMETTS